MDIILTLGSNPLPVVVAACALKERLQAGHAYLVYTPQTRDLPTYVSTALATSGLLVIPVEVSNHESVPELRRTLEQRIPADVWQSAHVHYSGGTKSLAAHVLAHARERGNRDNASRLAADGTIWFDDGRPQRANVKLKLDQLTRLHWGQEPVRSTISEESAKLAESIRAYVSVSGVVEYVKLLPPMYGTWDMWDRREQPVKLSDGTMVAVLGYNAERKSNFKVGAVFAAWNLKPLADALGHATPASWQALCGILGLGTRPDDIKSAAKFLYGGWLERWLAGHLARSGLFDEVAHSVKLPEEEGELDVVAIHGYRAYVFSCTVDAQEGKVKLKLFEAIHNAGRLGGDHARVGMVSMTESPYDVVKHARAVGWDGYDNFRVFGAGHLAGRAAVTKITKQGDPVAETLDDAIRSWVGA